MCTFMYCSLFANLILLASGSKLKAMENLFRGEIYLLREEVTSVATKQESIMKTLNETASKISDLTVFPDLSDREKKTCNTMQTDANNEHQMQVLSNLSEELVRTRRGFHEEKVARKQDKESLLDVLENKVAMAMITKIDAVIENVETSNKMLQVLGEKIANTQETLEALNGKVKGMEQNLEVLNGKVNGMDQKLDNLEKLHKNEIKERLDSISTAIEDKSLSSMSSVQSDIKLFKTIFMSVLGRLFSRDHYPPSAMQECLDLDTENNNDNHETTESCLVQNTQSFTDLVMPVIRLVGGRWFREGRVEVLYNGTYGTICDDNWTDVNAKVVCKMLGFTAGTSVFGDDMIKRFGRGIGNIILESVKCTGEETSLFQCPHDGFGIHNCGHVEDVAVTCS